MSEREKYSAFKLLSSTTFTIFGSLALLKSIPLKQLAIKAPFFIELLAKSINLVKFSSSKKGSSAWIFITISSSLSPRLVQASFILSLPLSCSLLVITAFMPCFFAIFSTLSSSQATTTSSLTFSAFLAVATNIGSPPISQRIFSLNLVLARRAGMIIILASP